MTREFLKSLELSDDAINSIMAENGKDIEKQKAKYADYDDVKDQLKNANAKIESFGDVEAIKGEVEKYKAELKKQQDESAAKILKMERQAKIKDVTASKKFVNDFTRNSINALLEEEMQKKENEGKSLEELLKVATDGKENIFVNEQKIEPPKVTNMNNSNKDDNDTADAKIRAVMGLPPKK